MKKRLHRICDLLCKILPNKKWREFFKHRRRMYRGENNHVWLVAGEERRKCGLWDLPRDFEISFKGDENNVEFGVPDLYDSKYLKNFLNAGKIDCRGNGNLVHIGLSKNVVRPYFNARIESGGRLTIGRDTWIGYNVSIFVHGMDNAEVKMGDECWIGDNAIIRNHDMHTVIDSTTGQALNKPQSVFIGNHEWITRHNTIMKGTQIADGCIIANLAFLNRVYNEPNCLLAGIPARVIKRGITWDGRSYERYLQDSTVM